MAFFVGLAERLEAAGNNSRFQGRKSSNEGMDMEPQELCESFFKSPDSKPVPGKEGVLYHLRVDLEKLYGKEGEFEGDSTRHAMLVMTGVLIGIEYISQCYFAKRQSGTAFVESLMDLGGVDWDNAEAMYQLRCSILHSFSLSTISDRKTFRKGTRFVFRLMDEAPGSLIRMESAAESEIHYKVNIGGLKACFLKMICELQKICLDESHKKHSEVLDRVCQRAAEKLETSVLIS